LNQTHRTETQQQQQQQPFYGLLSGTTRVSQYQKKHSPTRTYSDHQSSFIIYYDPQHPPCSIYMLDSLFAQSLLKSSLVYLLAWYPPLHTPYTSSPNHCLLFITHAHTKPMQPVFLSSTEICHLILVSLSTLYLELYLLPYHTSI